MERKLNDSFPSDRKHAFETRSGVMVKQYSEEYSVAYNIMLDNMVERRLRQSIYAVASFWYTAWINAGQPDLRKLVNTNFSEQETNELDELNARWKSESLKGRSCD
jgi:hypothetical protein